MNKDDLFSLQNATVLNAILKAQDVLYRHDRIVVSISGGSDSDVVLDMVERNKRDGSEIRYVWFDTGIEYQATKDHLDYLEQKYGIKIERIKAEKPIPLCVKEYGVPFLSKFASEMIMRLQRWGFKWEDEPFEELIKKYPRCVFAIRWWCNEYANPNKVTHQYYIEYYPYLKEFLIENPPPFKISKKCCEYSKKKVAKQIQKRYTADLDVVGVRKAEGGIRATSYKTCFTQGIGTDHFRPVFWLTDEDKRFYEQEFGIVHSDCYKKYGLKRTGCVGCPFGRNVTEELKVIEAFEPRLYKAVLNVFGQSYGYTQRYKQFRQRKKEEAKRDANQITIDFVGEE
ncbi:MAG: phosphoadenosine phosphosulfate reductase family protein [Clostridia bacterium]|nr:phosphoadenosine phosphosulfate reductase family protein [Clostridia bacterium]